MTHAHQIPTWHEGPARLYTGDAVEVLGILPDESVDCIVTSPPYYGLRDYGTGAWTGGHTPGCDHSGARPRAGTVCSGCGAVWTDRQYGLEPTLDAYIDTMRTVFTKARRVLARTGSLWLNLGDCYATGETGRNDTTTRYPSLTDHQPARHARQIAHTTGLPAKNLLGVPWRVALALQTDGWILRQAIVWHKPNAMPESVRDRPSASHEYLFLFSRSARYWFDLDPIRQPRSSSPHSRTPVGGTRPRIGILGASTRTAAGGKYTAGPQPFNGRRHGVYLRPGHAHDRAHPHGRNPGSVWSISTRPNRDAHFATFPIDLPLRCIATGCRPGGTVLDPFSGIATTGVAALQLHRSYVGVELNPAYNTIARRRLHSEVGPEAEAA
jgi:site-specific DNA-methyltransferase (cytosine-N4-specific)